MGFIGGRGQAALGKRFEGPYKIMNKTTGTSVTSDDYVVCTGARAVIIHVYSNTASAVTLSGPNPRGYTSADKSTNKTTADQLGVRLEIQGSTADINNGGWFIYTPYTETTDYAPSNRICAFALGAQTGLSASAADVEMDAWVVWD